MAKILGLDLGTNSIGWAVIDDEQKEILGVGSRIFSEGVNIDSKNQSETSKNKVRRGARGARRLNYRFKLRRKKLKTILKEIGLFPDNKFYTNKKGNKKEHTIELYKLRKDALEKEIRKENLGRIFLQINNHRGFLSNKKEEGEAILNDEKNENLGTVIKAIKGLQGKIDLAYNKNKIKHPYIGSYYYYLIEQNKDSFNPNEPIERIRGEKHYTLREMFEKEFDAIWEFQSQYHSELTPENKKRIKDETIFYQRDLRSQKHLRNKCIYKYKTYYKKDKEKNYIKDKNGDFIEVKKYLDCAPKSSFEFQEFRIWEQLNKLQYKIKGNNYYEELKDNQKNILANKLDTLIQIKLSGKIEEKDKLYLNQLIIELGINKQARFNQNRLIGNVTKAKLIEALGKDFWNKLYPKEGSADNEPIKYSNEQRTLWHNIYFSSNFIKHIDWLKGEQKSNGPVLRKNRKKQIQNTTWQKTVKKIGLNDEQLEKYSRIAFEPDICSYSTKALKELLSYMKQGYNPTKAATELGYESASDIRNNNSQLEYKIPPLKNNELRNAVVQRGVTEAIKIINTIIEEKDDRGQLKYGKPDEIRIELSRELRKSKDVRQKMHQRNEDKRKEREKYAEILSEIKGIQIDPSSDLIRKFELYLELDFSKQSIDDIKQFIDIKVFNTFCKNIDIRDHEKYKLWKECKRVDPYENRPISLSQLLSSVIEIEHIVPFSKSHDNSFLNKTLAFRDFNAKKLNKTPLEYFETLGKEEGKFLKQIKKFSKEKRKRFLLKSDEIEGFKNNQLNNNAYIATELKKHLWNSFPSNKVNVTNGVSTSIVRRLLGFNSILNPSFIVRQELENGKYWVRIDDSDNIIEYKKIKKEDKTPSSEKNIKIIEGYISYNEQKQTRYFYPKKSRDDHRHHTVDAITIALINTKINQIIANNSIIADADIKRIEKLSGKAKEDEYQKLNKFNEYGQFKKEVIEKIRDEIYKELRGFYNLRGNAVNFVKNTLVSHRFDQRITASSKKKVYKNGKPLNKNDKQVYSGGDVAQGSLHEAYFYGKTKDCSDGEFVRRIKVEDLSSNQIELIVDEKIKNIIKDGIKKYDDFKKAIKEGFFLKNEGKRKKRLNEYDENIPRKPVPIRKVRIKYKSKMIPLRPSENPKLFAIPGDNYLMAIYQQDTDKPNSKRDFELVNFFDAVAISKKSSEKKYGKLDLYTPISQKNNFPLYQVIKKGDMVLLYESSAEEEIKWDDNEDLFMRLYQITGLNISPNNYGRIYLMKHNDARKSSDLGTPITGAFKFGDNKIKRMLYHTQFNALIEGKDFKISTTGKITKIGK